MKKALVLLMALFVIMGCSQNKKKPGSDSFTSAANPPATGSKAHELIAPTKGVGTPDIISDEILAVYRGVIIEVVDKNAGKSAKVEVPFGSLVQVESTPLVIEVVQFYPDFVMSDEGYATRTMNPNNVAAKVKVTGAANEFEGWLFADFPGVHPYDSPDYDVVLIGALKK